MEGIVALGSHERRVDAGVAKLENGMRLRVAEEEDATGKEANAEPEDAGAGPKNR